MAALLGLLLLIFQPAFLTAHHAKPLPKPKPIIHLTAEQIWLRAPVTLCIKQAESGGNYKDSGLEYKGGAYQFNMYTWWGVGGTGYAADNPPAVQDELAYKLYLRSGGYDSQWQTGPECERKFG